MILMILIKKCYHIFSLNNNIITSYARIIPKEYSSYEDTSIGRVLVNKNYRRNGLAKKLMMNSIEFVTNNLNEEHITLSAQYYIKDYINLQVLKKYQMFMMKLVFLM